MVQSNRKGPNKNTGGSESERRRYDNGSRGQKGEIGRRFAAGFEDERGPLPKKADSLHMLKRQGNGFLSGTSRRNMIVYISPCHSLTSSQLTLALPRVLKSILYICVFTPVLPQVSSELFFFLDSIYIY